MREPGTATPHAAVCLPFSLGCLSVVAPASVAHVRASARQSVVIFFILSSVLVNDYCFACSLIDLSSPGQSRSSVPGLEGGCRLSFLARKRRLSCRYDHGSRNSRSLLSLLLIYIYKVFVKIKIRSSSKVLFVGLIYEIQANAMAHPTQISSWPRWALWAGEYVS